jgi:hypothetical protein
MPSSVPKTYVRWVWAARSAVHQIHSRHQAASAVAGAHQPAAVLAPVKDKPFGRARKTEIVSHDSHEQVTKVGI